MVALLVVVALVSSLSRYLLPPDLHTQIGLVLYGPYTTEQLPVLAQHPALEFAHRIGGSLYIALGVAQFMPRLRRRFPALHRWSGRAFLLLSLLAVSTGVWMVIRFPYRGLAEAIPTLLFAAIFTCSGARALWHARRREFSAHREWIIRNFSIGLGIASIRVVHLILMYTTSMESAERFVTSFWLGWVLNSLAAELWINATRPRRVLHGELYGFFT